MARFIKLSVLALVSCLAFLLSPGASALFVDVDYGDWYYEYVSAAADMELVNGTGDRRFSPEGNITRAQFITILGRMAGVSEDGGHVSSGYSDVPEDAYYAPYVSWGEETGVISSDTLFRPHSPITRQELAAMVSRFVSTLDVSLEPAEDVQPEFSDMDQVSPWAVEHVEAMRVWGLLQGDGNGRLNPTDETTRAQATAVLVRLSELLGEENVSSGSVEPSVQLTPRIFRYIYHAGGYTGEHINTNSLEALEAVYDPEGCLIELDFNWTSDGGLAAIHYWSQEYSPDLEGYQPPTLSQWRDAKVYGVYTSLDLARLITWLYENPAAYIATDIKADNLAGLEKIAHEYPEFTNRFIPQIYSYEEYQPVRDMGYENIILTVYMMSSEDARDTAAISEFVRENGITAVTFPVAMAQEEGYIQGLDDCGALLLTHTANGHETRAYYFGLGVDGIYTDFPPWLPDQPEGTG